MNHHEVMRLNALRHVSKSHKLKRTHDTFATTSEKEKKTEVDEYVTITHPFQRHLETILQQVGVSLSKLDQLPVQLPWNHSGYIRWDLMEPAILLQENDIFPNSTVSVFWVVTKLRLDCWGIDAFLKQHNYFNVLTCCIFPRASRMVRQLFFQKLQTLFFPRYVHWPNTHEGDNRVLRHIMSSLNHCFSTCTVLVPLHDTNTAQNTKHIHIHSVTYQLDPYETIYGRRHSLQITLHSDFENFVHFQRCWSDPQCMDECYYSLGSGYVVFSEIVSAVSRFIDRDTFCVFLMGLKSPKGPIFRQFVAGSLAERKVLKHVLQFCGY
jgi:hypothetical protein